MRLDERKLKLLNIIVENYIKTGEPVGSKFLCEQLDFAVSSATIRNEMASLVELGFLEQPYTSAGRVPTNISYRLYVDYMMKEEILSNSDKRYIDASMYDFSDEPEQIAEQTANLLANITDITCFVTTPTNPKSLIRNLQLVPVGRHSMLIVMITSDGILKTKFCRLDFELTPDMLRVFSRIANRQIAGLPLIEITPAFIQTLAVALGDLFLFMSPVLLTILEVARAAVRPQAKFAGYENLLYHNEINPKTQKNVLHFLTQENGVERMLLTKPISGTRVIIGNETNRPEFGEISIIVTPYRLTEHNAGIIGMVGPTRMSYSENIAKAEYIADSMSNLLLDILKV